MVEIYYLLDELENMARGHGYVLLTWNEACDHRECGDE
jgi:hypothetical protein